LPGETTRVVIHDGARPLVTPELISLVVEALGNWQGIVAAVPLKDTIKKVDAEKGIIATIERTGLWAAQTPQVFLPEVLMEAHQKARMDGFYGTDDSILLERLGYKVKVVMGSYENVKITTPEDLPVAEAILRLKTMKESGQR
jgi:2-C-methyl-D-erythritol 4-phosphate cytidylyltransferase